MIKKPRITEKLYKWNAIKQKLRLKSCKNWYGLKNCWYHKKKYYLKFYRHQESTNLKSWVEGKHLKLPKVEAYFISVGGEFQTFGAAMLKE